MDLPKCQKCNNGILIPLSDYGQEGASVIFKAWACTNPDCGFSLRVDKGEVSYGKKIDHKHRSLWSRGDAPRSALRLLHQRLKAPELRGRRGFDELKQRLLARRR